MRIRAIIEIEFEADKRPEEEQRNLLTMILRTCVNQLKEMPERGIDRSTSVRTGIKRGSTKVNVTDEQILP